MLRQFFASVGSLVGARAFQAISQVLALPIVARYLPVEDFAVMALAMSVVIFGTMVSDGGLGRSLIRAKTYDRDEWSSVFWLLVLIGLGLAAAVAAFGPIWAWFFDLPQLIPVLAVMATFPLMQSLSAVPSAELERRERYPAIATIQTISTAIGLVAAIGLAVLGFGVWALVWQQIALAATRLAGLFAISHFRPNATFSMALVRGHFGFARDSIAVSFIQLFTWQMPVVVIGRVFGQIPLGQFAMAQRFTRLPNFGLAGPASTVVYVRMAKVQDDPARIAGLYLASMRLLAVILIPPMAMISVAGEAIFTILLSEQWAPVGLIFALTIPSFTTDAVVTTCMGAAFRATGRTTPYLRFMTEAMVLRVVLVLVMALHSFEAVALAMSLSTLAMIPRGWSMMREFAELTVGTCFRTLLPPLLVSAAFIAGFLAVATLSPLGDIVQIAVAVAATLAAYGVLYLISGKRLKADLNEFRG
ncbi:MAG: oligosaccharide flippase family protein [Pseudomonadota bacterium]